MRKTVIIAFFVSLIFGLGQTAFTQNLVETRMATLVPGDYATQGTVYLELYDDGSLNVRFGTDYQTQSNVFDVHVYLTNSNNYNAPINLSNTLLVENIGTINGINYSSGPNNFNLPANTGIYDYAHIVLVCVQFGRLHWAHGDFGLSYPNLSNVMDYCSSTPSTPSINVPTIGTINGTPNVSFPINTLGTTTVTWSFADGQGNTSSSTQQVTLNALPTTISMGTNELTLDQPVMNSSYQWLDCNNAYAPIAGATNSNFMPSGNGNYALEITYNGCVDTSNCLTYNITSIATPNQATGNISIYPNPSQGQFTLESSYESTEVQVHIINTMGQLVHTQLLAAQQQQLTLDDFPKGIYMVQVTGSGINHSSKVIVQ